MRPFHDIPHVYTAEYEHYLRELKLPTGAARTALLTFIPSHPVIHEPTNGTRNAPRFFDGLRGNICRYGEMIDGIQFAKATAAAVKWVTECALWIGEGLVDLGEALWEWGKSAARDPAGAWESIKKAVVEALDFLIELIMQKAWQMIEKLIEPVQEAMDKFSSEIYSAFMLDFQGFNNYGNSQSSDGALGEGEESYSPGIVSLLLSGNFFISLVALALVLQAVVTYVIVQSAGMSSISGAVWDYILPLLVLAIVGEFSGGWAGTLGTVLRQASGGIWDFIEEDIIKENYDSDDNLFWDEGFGLNLLSYMSCIINLLGNVCLKSRLGLKDSLLKTDAFGLALVFLSVIFGYLSLKFEDGAETEYISLTGNQANMLLSLAGLTLCVYGFTKTTPNDPLDKVGGKVACFEELIALVATGYAFVAFGESFWKVIDEL